MKGKLWVWKWIGFFFLTRLFRFDLITILVMMAKLYQLVNTFSFEWIWLEVVKTYSEVNW